MKRPRKKRDRKSRRSGLPSWELPHNDAEAYITDFLRRIPWRVEPEPDDERYDFYQPGDQFLPEKEVEERRSVQQQKWLRDRARADEDSHRYFDEYEGALKSEVAGGGAFSSDILEDAVELADRIATAREALLEGDAELVLEALAPLLVALPDEDDVAAMEHWSSLLADHRQAKSEQEKERADARKQVVQAVKDLCERLCHIIAKDGTALQEVEWRHLEHVVAHALSGIGFEVVLTPPSKDGGKDIVATCTLKGRRVSYYIEIKHWRSGKRVGANLVFDFVEVNTTEGTEGGLFIATGGFSDNVFCRLAEVSRERIRLGEETKVVTLCQHFVRRGQGLWTSERTLPDILFEHTIA